MLDYLTDPQTWAAFFTLTVLEIVLGIDNLVFLAITSSRLPQEQQAIGRRIGLALALILRVGLLLTLTWLAALTTPLFTVAGFDVSGRDLVLGLGGLYLFYKGVHEISLTLEGDETETARPRASLVAVIAQIMVLDLVFSLDSIVTAVGMTNNLPVMIAAIVVAIFVMMFAAGPVSGFINTFPSVKMLALAFLILVGTALVADAAHFHIPRGYLYFAIAFSIGVESLNLWRRMKIRRRGPVGEP
jgi:predicted tellurium resistance membrane protein TerC